MRDAIRKILFAVCISVLLTACTPKNTNKAMALPGVDDSAIAVDLNSDGKTDLLQPGQETARVFRNDSGSFSESEKWKPNKVSAHAGELPMALLMSGDLNQDDKPDVLVGQGLRTQVWIAGEGLRDRFVSPSGLAFEDVDGDGKPDFIARGKTDRKKRSPLRLFRMTNVNELTLEETEVVDRIRDLYNYALADLDGDGAPELVVQSRAGFQIYRNEFRSGGTFSKVGEPKKLDGDLVGFLFWKDQKPSTTVCVWSKDEGKLSLMVANKKLSLREFQSFPSKTRPMSLQVGHFNDDKKLDLVTLNSPEGIDTLPPNQQPTINRYDIYMGEDGSKLSPTPITKQVRVAASSIVVGQFDGKGPEDLGFLGYDERFSVHLTE